VCSFFRVLSCLFLLDSCFVIKSKTPNKITNTLVEMRETSMSRG
jgi:hypothetical protein